MSIGNLIWRLGIVVTEFNKSKNNNNNENDNTKTEKAIEIEDKINKKIDEKLEYMQ